MVQCYSCKKFVHGTCDSEADPLIYQQRKEAKPDYEYICLHCKNMAMVARRKDSIDEGDLNLSASQESLDGESSELDYQGGSSEEALYSVGLGKGKPSYCQITKIAKKRIGISGGILGRPKGIGKLGYQKRQKMTEFGRKRGPKAKMRGLFGLPEMGLQVYTGKLKKFVYTCISNFMLYFAYNEFCSLLVQKNYFIIFVYREREEINLLMSIIVFFFLNLLKIISHTSNIIILFTDSTNKI